MIKQVMHAGVAVGLAVAMVAPGVAEARKTGNVRLCASPQPGQMQCLAKAVTDAYGAPRQAKKPTGYSPAQLAAAYGISGSSGGRVAVVVAYHDPAILDEVNAYSSTFGLPGLVACGSISQGHCLRQIDQRGGSNFPRADSGWALETALDVETVHGLCPGCRIDLIEAASPTTSDLLAGVDTAASNGARVISNSWGGPESSGETLLDHHFARNGSLAVVSSGDDGYGVGYPAASPNVLAVGGTTLRFKSGTYGSESAWDGSGSGCSVYEAKPSWQHDTACAKRAVADVSADANPSTGAAIYSVASSGRGAWYTVGGTSLAAPIVAAAIASSGTNLTGLAARWYGAAASSNFHDITRGTTGNCATYLCRGHKGYDGPTGLGSLLNGAF